MKTPFLQVSVLSGRNRSRTQKNRHRSRRDRQGTAITNEHTPYLLCSKDKMYVSKTRPPKDGRNKGSSSAVDAAGTTESSFRTVEPTGGIEDS